MVLKLADLISFFFLKRNVQIWVTVIPFFRTLPFYLVLFANLSITQAMVRKISAGNETDLQFWKKDKIIHSSFQIRPLVVFPYCHMFLRRQSSNAVHITGTPKIKNPILRNKMFDNFDSLELEYCTSLLKRIKLQFIGRKKGGKKSKLIEIE